MAEFRNSRRGHVDDADWWGFHVPLNEFFPRRGNPSFLLRWYGRELSNGLVSSYTMHPPRDTSQVRSVIPYLIKIPPMVHLCLPLQHLVFPTPNYRQHQSGISVTVQYQCGRFTSSYLTVGRAVKHPASPARLWAWAPSGYPGHRNATTRAPSSSVHRCRPKLQRPSFGGADLGHL